MFSSNTPPLPIGKPSSPTKRRLCGKQCASALWSVKPPVCPVHASQLLGPARTTTTSGPFLVALHEFKDYMVPPHYAGRMHSRCDSCGAYMFPGEAIHGPTGHTHYNLCCHNGKAMHDPKVAPPPHPLLSLLTDRSSRSRPFLLKVIRQYNAALAFVSCGAGQAPPLVVDHLSSAFFRIHGAV